MVSETLRNLAHTLRQNRYLLLLLVLSIVVRAGVLLVTPHALEADPDGYRCLAENIRQHGTFGYGDRPTAYRPPLYPLLLAPLTALGSSSAVAIGVLHVLLGLATVAVVVRVAGCWGLGRYAILAGALVALDPVLVWQSALVMTETLATFLTVVALWALTAAARPEKGDSPHLPARPEGCFAQKGTVPFFQRRTTKVFLAGAATGLAALCRPTYLPWMAVCALVLPRFAEGWAMRVKMLAVYGAAGAAVLSPWIVRNQIQYGHPIAGTTHGGYTLLLGNNPWLYDYLRHGGGRAVWDSRELDRWWVTEASRATPEEEIRSDRLAYQLAKQTIRRQPRMFVCSCLVRVGWFWSPLPHATDAQEGPGSRWARYAVGAGYVAEWVLALVGLVMVFRRGGWLSTWGWGLLLVMVFTAVHALYWSNIRMRSPVVPVLAMAAAAGTAGLLGRVLRRK